MIRVESSSNSSWTCSDCEKPVDGAIVVTIGKTAIALCRECAPHVADAIHDKRSIIDTDALPSAEVTANGVTRFATYPLDLLLDELVMCTVRWHVGPLVADKQRLATALIERLAVLGIARKVHRVGCEIWPKYRLCTCPWEVAA